MPNSRTLYMGDLPAEMNEQQVIQLWSQMGYSINVKLIREKVTQKSLYCFLEFPTPQQAEQALQYNTLKVNELTLKLGWASNQTEYSLFVGDIPQMDDQKLMELFKLYNCTSAKVVIDPQTQHTKGYGFVRFPTEADQQQALREMNGVLVGSRPIRVSLATPKQKNKLTNSDPTNTTVFVGGLQAHVTEQELAAHFMPFGQIMYVKIPPGMGCGFVSYQFRQSAELAIQQMAGYFIGGSPIRLSWGNSPMPITPVPQPVYPIVYPISPAAEYDYSTYPPPLEEENVKYNTL